MEKIWLLDHIGNSEECYEYMKKHGYDKNKHEKFFIGQEIEFWTGYNDDIRARARIKGISGNDLYVYNDCYWYPIQDNEITNIAIV
jgi:hypothetical protein